MHGKRRRSLGALLVMTLAGGALVVIAPTANAAGATKSFSGRGSFQAGGKTYKNDFFMSSIQTEGSSTQAVNTSASYAVQQTNNGLTRRGSLGTSVPNNGFQVTRDGDKLRVVTDTKNGFGTIGGIDAVWEGEFTSRCNGHIRSARVQRKNLTKANMDAFGAHLQGGGDLFEKANVTTWDGTNVNRPGCPGGPTPNPGPITCSPESAGLSGQNFDDQANASGLKFKRRNRQGQLVNVVSFFSTFFQSDYQGTGLSAFHSITGIMGGNTLTFGQPATLGTEEVGTLKGNGGYVTGELVVNRTDPYSYGNWSNCRKGGDPHEQRTGSGQGEIDSSNLTMHFLDVNKVLNDGDSTFASLSRRQVRKKN